MAPLDHIRVVDATGYLAGPFAAMMLADLGADVIKVERPPKGDPLRTIGHRFEGQSVQCDNVNRNKRSVLLDLGAPDGRDDFLHLLAGADVVLLSWRPGVAEALGLGDDALAAANPQLVRVWITGYGPDGPLADRPAFDALIQAHTGLAWRHRHDGRPAELRTYLADKVTSALAAQAALGALVGRDRTGTGERVEISMLDAVAYFNFPELMEDRTYGWDPATTGERPLPRSFVVATADGWLAVAPAKGSQVQAALRAIGHPEWIAEVRAVTDPIALIAALLDRIESVTTGEPTAVWVKRFGAADVPVAEVLGPDAHLADPQVVHNRLYGEVDDPVRGPMRYVRYPARFAGDPEFRLRGPAPSVGQHTEEVLVHAPG